MTATLYKRQKQILDFINENINKYSCAPTLTEIAAHLGLSSLATVHEHLAVLGFIACGTPLEPFTDPNATLAVNSALIKSGDKSYVLQAKGDSMIDDGILNGDYLVIKEQQDARNGDIVVAVLKNGFATLKRFYKEATRIRLQPANSTMSPIYVTDVEIRGKVVAVIRQFN